MSDLPSFAELMTQRRADGFTPPEGLLTIDPGATTGFSFWQHGRLNNYSQVLGTPQNLRGLLVTWNPTLVVFESYRLYPWKLQEQSWSEAPTVKLIGVLEFLLSERNVPFVKQTAGAAKTFATNEKLRAWGLYVKGKPHALDSIRHGVCYLLTSPIPKPAVLK